MMKKSGQCRTTPTNHRTSIITGWTPEIGEEFQERIGFLSSISSAHIGSAALRLG